MAERQGGVLSLGQLREAGLNDTAVGRLVERGQLVRLYPGVYALGHRPLTIEGRLRAAILHGGPGAALSHTTAAWWWGLLEAVPRVIHLSAGGRPDPARGLRVHRPRLVRRVIHRGLPVTPVARTLLDLAAAVSSTELRLAVAEADYCRRLEPAGIAAVIGRGRPGSAALRRALAAHLPELARANSPLEVDFLLLCERAGIPAPEANVRIGRFKVDCLWRDRGLVVELDGRAGHAHEAAFERDRRRDLELRAAGYAVLRYSRRQVLGTPAAVVADLTRALARDRPRTQRDRR